MNGTGEIINEFGYALNILGLDFMFDKLSVGTRVELALILFLGIFIFFARSKVRIVFEMFYETMYDFFAEVSGEGEKKRVKGTIVTVFFVIFFANMLGWLGDILAQAIPSIEEYFAPFSSGQNGTYAMSSLAVLVMIAAQFQNVSSYKHYIKSDNIFTKIINYTLSFFVGIYHFVLEYLPIFGKNYLTVEKGDKSWFVYILMYIPMKVFDIIISLFIGILDIVGVLARVISLSSRLFGNMMAGTTLLVLLTGGSIALSKTLSGFEFPIILPLILFFQGLLVSLIQAFVVALLTAIFIKMTRPVE